VITQTHRQVQRCFARQEIVDLSVVKALQGLHDALFRTLCQKTRFDAGQQSQAAAVADAVVSQRSLAQVPVFPEEAYPFFGHFESLGNGLFDVFDRFKLVNFEFELAASGGRHRHGNERGRGRFT